MKFQFEKYGFQIPAFFREIEPIILPDAPHVALLRCRFDLAAYDDGLFSQYQVTFPNAIRASVLKRRAEYFAGRFLCRQLLLHRGLAPQVEYGRHHQPLWPQGWIGSITHNDDVALVALTEEIYGRLLGIDLESWMSPELAAETKDLVVLPGELASLGSDWLPERLLTLVFSAKESLFKALYPTVREYFGFDSAELVHLDDMGRRFVISLRRTLARDWIAGKMIEGRWLLLPGQILTVIAAG